MIGIVSSVLSLSFFLATLAYHEDILLHLERKLQESRCAHHYSGSSGSGSLLEPSSHNTTSSKIILQRQLSTADENECVFLAFSTLYPWPLWGTLSFYVLLNINLVLSAIYK